MAKRSRDTCPCLTVIALRNVSPAAANSTEISTIITNPVETTANTTTKTTQIRAKTTTAVASSSEIFVFLANRVYLAMDCGNADILRWLYHGKLDFTETLNHF